MEPPSCASEARALLDEAHLHLNPQQLEAFRAGGGPILVLAGAGSGKTRVLTWRVARLLSMGVQPQAICLLTFTNRAAQEMLQRVRLLTPGADTSLLWGGTFHQMANRALKLHAHLLGYPRDFSIVDAEDTRRLMGASLNHLKTRAGVSPGTGLPQPQALVDLYSTCVNTSFTLPQALAARLPAYRHQEPFLRQVFIDFAQRKQDRALMDFDDLLLGWYRLISEVDSFRAAYARQFEHVLVDEYQDINHLQNLIVNGLASYHRNLMVVGDDCQSIYAFRGVDWRNILSFPERNPGARLFRLETNYRSTPQILHLANASIAHNPRQLPKTLVPAEPAPGPRPALIKCGDAREQASLLTQRLGELHAAGHRWRDMAVLYRAHWHAMELQVALAQARIPFLLRSGIRFFEQAHIKDLLAFLRLLHNPRDSLALGRIMALLQGVGARSVDKLSTLCLAATDDPLQALLSPRALRLVASRGQPQYRIFVALVQELLQQGGASAPPDQALLHIHQRFYQDRMSQRFQDADLRQEDVAPLIGFAARFGNFEALLGELALLSSAYGQDLRIDSREPAGEGDGGGDGGGGGGGDGDDDALCLTTIHQAKGLEWPVVCVIGLADQLMPGPGAARAQDLEEERRLLYVAITRAMRELYLLWPARVREQGSGHWTWAHPSRFLEELEDERDPGGLPLWETWQVQVEASARQDTEQTPAPGASDTARQGDLFGSEPTKQESGSRSGEEGGG